MTCRTSIRNIAATAAVLGFGKVVAHLARCLHDGRAATVDVTIRLHDGEAAIAR